MVKKIIENDIIKNDNNTLVFHNKKNNSIIKCISETQNENKYDNDFLKELEFTLKYQDTSGPNVLNHHVEYEHNNIKYFGFEMEYVGPTIYNYLKNCSSVQKRVFLNQHRQQIEDIFKIFSSENIIYLDINLNNFTILNNKIYVIDFEPRFLLKFPDYCSSCLQDVMKCLFSVHVNRFLQIRHYFKYGNILNIIYREPDFLFIYNYYIGNFA